jgi:hypothetical protein
MKKIIALILVSLLCFSVASCANSGSDSTCYKLGDTVSTDIFEFTLNAAEFTLALNNIHGDDFYTPKEYDPQDDGDNPYVAPIGHTYVAFSYTVTNLNRASSEFHNGSFATVKYNKKKYNNMEDGAFYQYEKEQVADVNGNLETRGAGEWYSNPASNLFLLTGEKETRRAFIDIDTEITNMSEDIEITFKIPNSEGKKEAFTYLVTAADREAYTKPEIEMSLETALESFTKESGRTYFAEHMDEYPVISGNDASKILTSKKWNISYIIKNMGYWSGTFVFEDGGRIKDDYGYENNRTWSVNGDTIIIDDKYSCEMRKVSDRAYLLICEGEPYLLMK